MLNFGLENFLQKIIMGVCMDNNFLVAGKRKKLQEIEEHFFLLRLHLNIIKNARF